MTHRTLNAIMRAGRRGWTMVGTVTVGLCLCAMACSTHAARLALVIGNDNYSAVEKLKNARADAAAMAKALEKAGFVVERADDLDRAGMNRVLRRFRQKIGGGDEIVLFYAGHGVELMGSNYLLPVDIRAEEEEQIREDAISLQSLLDDLQERRPNFSLAIVDACRDNPMKGVGRNVGSRGLKPVTAATGQMVVYSAGAGQKALDRLSDDDRSPNGVFTRVFVQEMLKGGEPVQLTVARVRREVARLAATVGRVQVPALYDQSVGEFMFVSGEASRSPVEAPTSAKTDEDERMWQDAKGLDTEEGYEAYLEAYPKGRYVKFAQAAKKKATQRTEESKRQDALAGESDKNSGKVEGRATPQQNSAEKQAFEVARGANTTIALREFLKIYPNGDYRSMAVAALAEVARTEAARRLQAIPSAAPPAPTVPKLSYADLQVFRECEVCPEMVVVPGGAFEMGGRMGSYEQPQHRVTVPRFAMGKYEVTQREWKALMGSNPSGFDTCGDNCPVDRVSWDDAKAYIRKLNENVSGRSDGPYRLPSEAEWEYVCRGGVGGEDYCGGNEVDRVAWHTSNSGSKTQRVGTKSANRWGLHDMSGNIWEWTEDCWNESYRLAPESGSAWTSGDCSRRVVRGGAWDYEPAYVRSAYRSRVGTALRYNDTGFRVARTLP